MARLDQPSTSANAKTSMEPAPQGDAAQSARTGVLPLVGVLAALAIAAGAYVYHQVDSGTTTTAPQATASDNMASTPTETTTSDNTASAPTETTPLGTEVTSSSAQSAATVPNAGVDKSARATPSVHSNAIRPHRVAKTSKPARALEPRDRQVVLTTSPQPAYPLQALRAGEQGTVLVLAQIDVDGQVTDARVVRQSGSRILDRAAPDEVRHWKFEPARHAGRPVIASVEVPVNYRLNQ
jgi:protein TonB